MANKFDGKIEFNSMEQLLRKDYQEKDILLEETHAFKEHPFLVRDDEAMDQLVRSIELQGVLDPIIVRERKEGGYEIISGHRRSHAAKRAGNKTIKARIVKMTDAEATLAMVDSNMQRDEILPSEKAKSTKQRLDAINALRKESRDKCGQLDHIFRGKRSIEVLAEESNESPKQIQRYIQLNKLIPELLELMDEKKIKMAPGLEISYMQEEDQRALLGIIQSENLYPTAAEAKELKELSQSGECSASKIFSMLVIDNLPSTRIVLDQGMVMEYFRSDQSKEEILETIERLLHEWKYGK